ncbi:hypothetical protein ACFPYI_04065 [Halomarina salina]|uniref:Uncharacterized protein n=1 Tax=Halomarina salina TaxID=1872699 RepID=A0ABD5RJM7_9EURY|nr:hypothetical protein [Halomarina salina]
MTPHDPSNVDRPLPDCAVVQPHPDGTGVTIDKSVVEAALDESDHGLVPDVAEDRASDELLQTLTDAFTYVTPRMSPDIASDRREAAETIRTLHERAVPVYVRRRRR